MKTVDSPFKFITLFNAIGMDIVEQNQVLAKWKYLKSQHVFM
jgi:hypothetical protein